MTPQNDLPSRTFPDDPGGKAAVRTTCLNLGRVALSARGRPGPGRRDRQGAVLPAVGRPVERPSPRRAALAGDWPDSFSGLSHPEWTKTRQSRTAFRPPERESAPLGAGGAPGWDLLDRPARPGGEEGRPASRQERILAAAEEEFAARGFFGARLERIAAQGACNKALIHYYYKDKTGLYAAALKEALASLLNRLGQVPTAGLKPKSILVQVVSAFLDFGLKEGRSAQIIIRDLVDHGRGLRAALAAFGQGGEGGEARWKAISDGLAPALAPGLDPIRLLLWILALSLACSLEGSAQAVLAEERLAADKRQILTLLAGQAFVEPA